MSNESVRPDANKVPTTPAMPANKQETKPKDLDGHKPASETAGQPPKVVMNKDDKTTNSAIKENRV